LIGKFSRLAGALLWALLCVLPSTAMAQAAQCHLPARVDPGPPPRPNSEPRRVPIGAFTLAATWSPEFCFSHRDQADSLQCSGRLGRLGFVLHGLWPEASSGPSPEWCQAPSLTARPAPELLRRNLCMTPSAQLLEHEWARHGSCMAQSPEAYFRIESALWHSLHWPDVAGMGRQRGLTVGKLRAAFLGLNRGWRADQVAVMVSGNGWLSAVQLCYGRDLKPAGCPAERRGAPDAAALKISRGP